MKHFNIFAIIGFFMISASSCATPINQYNAMNYAKSAHNYSNSGDWHMARKHWARAAHNAELSGMDKANKAIYYYELGRASGVTCYYEKAEEYLTKSYKLDAEIGGPVHMSLVELFRLNLDQKNYDKAVEYFKRLLLELDKINAEIETPAEYSRLLEEYSMALSGLGKNKEAAQMNDRAGVIEKSAVNSVTDRTPYGEYCLN